MPYQLIGTLDLWVLLVEYIFGSIFLALIGWGVIILVAGIMGRMSFSSTLLILMTYGATALIGYIGALAAVPIMMIALWYMMVGILNRINELR